MGRAVDATAAAAAGRGESARQCTIRVRTQTARTDDRLPALALPAALLLAARHSGTPALSARVAAAAAVSAAGNHGERVVRAAARHRHVARAGAGRNAL